MGQGPSVGLDRSAVLARKFRRGWNSGVPPSTEMGHCCRYSGHSRIVSRLSCSNEKCIEIFPG